MQNPQGTDGTLQLHLRERKGEGEVKQLCVSMYCRLHKDRVKKKVEMMEKETNLEGKRGIERRGKEEKKQIKDEQAVNRKRRNKQSRK